jgi:hypothetical protein
VRGGGAEQSEDTLMKTPENIERREIAAQESVQRGTLRAGELPVNNHALKNDFTPCVGVGSLLKKIHQVARNALPGYVILFSPACSSFDQFGNNQGVEKVRTRAKDASAPTTGSRNTDFHRYMQAVVKKRQDGTIGNQKYFRFASGFFEEKTRGKKHNPQNIPQDERTLTSAN